MQPVVNDFGRQLNTGVSLGVNSMALVGTEIIPGERKLVISFCLIKLITLERINGDNFSEWRLSLFGLSVSYRRNNELVS